MSALGEQAGPFLACFSCLVPHRIPVNFARVWLGSSLAWVRLQALQVWCYVSGKAQHQTQPPGGGMGAPNAHPFASASAAGQHRLPKESYCANTKHIITYYNHEGV